MGPLVSPSWLAAHLGNAEVRVIDCRFALGRPGAGRQAYRQAHIPGATFLDLDEDLSGPPGNAGRHPLPDPEAFGAAARRAGISADSAVVAYDDGTGGAARLWWLLRHFGHERAAVLDGGVAAWEGSLVSGEEQPPAGDFVPRPRTGDTVGAEEVLRGLGDETRVLLDARAPERYRGQTEPIDPVAGHIPGAANLPFAEAFPPPDDLLSTDRELVAYCGSGVTACAVVLAFAAAGRDDVKLYPGSWSEWSGRGLPAETGG